MKKILLTGFEPFGDVAVNPSELLMAEMARRKPFPAAAQITTEVLPVVYAQAVDRIQTLIAAFQPDILLSFGVAARRKNVCPERVALNLKDAQLPDNAGQLSDGELLIPAAPLAYFSNMPLKGLRTILQKADIPVSISNHAGAYLCNAVFFAAAHQIESQNLDILYDFIHVPPIPQPDSTLSVPKLADGVEAILRFLLDFSQAR